VIRGARLLVRGFRVTPSDTALLLLGAVAIAALAGLVLGGRPVSGCWTGVGPAPEPQTSQCEASFVAGLSPFERLEYDAPILAAVLIGVLVFAGLVAALLVARALARRRSASR
jgi:hypothetical protein